MFGIFKQTQTHKSNGVKTTKVTNKKTGVSKTSITRGKAKPKRPSTRKKR